MENKRDFKGVWCPASIWNSNILSTNEKHLLHEIDSFTSNDNPCFASNEYFSKFLNCSEYTISRMIKNLKELGLIMQHNFDGRKRYLKSLICEFSEAELRKRLFRVAENARQDCEKRNILNTSTNTINNTSTNTDFPKNGKSDFNNLNDFSIKEEKKERKSSAKKKETIYPFNDQDFLDAWNLWKQYKKEQFRFTYKGTISEQTALKQLADKSDNDKAVAISIIQASMANGYMGLFRPNKNENQKDRGNSVSTDAELSAALDRRYGRSEQSVFDSADN